MFIGTKNVCMGSLSGDTKKVFRLEFLGLILINITLK
jgi:hypothetical protein